MRIAIEGRVISAKGGGVKTYAYQLIRHLLKVVPAQDVTVIIDRATARGTFPAARELLVPLRHETFLPLWLRWQIPRALRQLKPDVVHFTKADVPSGSEKPRHYKTVVTIFDVIPILFPAGQTLLRRLYWPRALERAALTSHHIITISEASKRDIIARYGVPDDKVTVTPLAVETNHFRPASKDARWQKPYLLFVGTLEPRKNVPLLVRAFARVAKNMPHQLVIAGKSDSDYGNILREIEVKKLTERVKIVDFINYEDLPALYSGADLFIWPSVYEGWGFPPQEAMACGTPVVVSDGGALPEVVGSAGEVVSFSADSLPGRMRDIDFEEHLANKILSVLNDQGKREEMSRAGLERVKQFSWDEVAKRTAGVYKQLTG